MPKNLDDLSRFLSNVQGHPLLTAEEEILFAKRLHKAKQECWKQLFTYAPISGCAQRHLKTQISKVLAVKPIPKVRKRTHTKALQVLAKKSVPSMVKTIERLDHGDLWLHKCWAKLQTLPPSTARDKVLQRIEQEYAIAYSAKERFFLSNLRLAITHAKRNLSKACRLDFFDLIQESYHALWCAIDKFDTTRKCRFSTYVTWWLEQALLRAQVNTGKTIRVPVYIVDKKCKLTKQISLLKGETGLFPTIEELAKSLKTTTATIANLQLLPIEVALVDTEPTDECPTKQIHLSSLPNLSPSPEDIILAQNLNEYLGRLLSQLTDREQHVISKRYGLQQGEALDRQALAKLMGISRERVRQIELGAIQKLQRLNKKCTLI